MNFLIEFEYEAEEPDELTVHKGDIVKNVKEYEDGWMIGTLNGKKGVFPSNFGKEIQIESKKSPAPVNDDESASNDTEDEVTKEIICEERKPQQKKVIGVGFGNIFSGQQIQLKHTNVSESKNQVAEDSVKQEIQGDRRLSGGSNNKVELVKVTHSYKAENPDELQIEEGDIVTVIDKKCTDDGWWQGKLKGKVGVFPNNFVIPISSDETAIKPSRPLVVTKAPPPLTAKPSTFKPKATPSRPSNPDSYKVTAKSSTKTEIVESEEVTFDSPTIHKPLVGPTAERVRRQNIRLPKKGVIANNNDEEKTISVESGKITPSKEKSIEVSPLEKSIKGSLLRDKPTETSAVDNKTQISTTKTSALKERFAEDSVTTNTKSVIGREKSKDFPDFDTSLKNRISQERTKESASISPETPESKSGHRPKFNQTNSNAFSRDIDNVRLSKPEDTDVLKKKIISLELKVCELEDEQAILRGEITDLSKSHSDQISKLTNTINKLLKDFEEEKSKRLAMENKLANLTASVDNLEQSMG